MRSYHLFYFWKIGAFFLKIDNCSAGYSVINNLTNKKYRLLHWRRRKRDFLFVFWIQLTNRHYRLDTSHGTNSEYIWGGWWWLDTIPILRTKHQNTGCLYSIFRHTDLGSLIGNVLCESLRIFLPLKFSVKSIW